MRTIITIGPFSLYPYGIAAAVFSLLAICWTAYQLRGSKRGTASWFALLSLLLGFIGSRLGYVPV